MTQAHTARAHARLAPSAAHRWLHCPGSVRLSEGIPDTTSSFAAEGTAAHELCARCLETGDKPADYLGLYVDIKATDAKKRFIDTPFDTDDEHRFFPVDDEMADAVTMYVEHVGGLCRLDGSDFVVDIEQRLDMTHLHPEIYGTGDATVLDIANRHLHVCDFKYGKGVAVDAVDNPQLLLYAAGAARRHHNARIERLTMHIIQPRAPHALGPIRTYDIELTDLFEFEFMLADAAKRTEAEDAPVVAGEWCRFCKAQPVCPAARNAALAVAADDFGVVDIEALPAPESMSDAKLGAVLREADFIGNWVKAVQEFAHAQATAGKPVTGFKLVAKRAIRKWANEEAAKQHLYDLGATNDDILTEPKLKSPAQVEKLFPGKNAAQRQAAMADLVEKKSSGTNLVPIEDPRPAVVVGAANEFEAVEV